MAVGRVKEDAMTKLRAIKEKAERDGLAEVYPVVQERVVIQRVTQQINTSGSSKLRVYQTFASSHSVIDGKQSTSN